MIRRHAFLSRRELLRMSGGAAAAFGLCRTDAFAEDTVLRRKIPTTGELLPAVGLGTYDSLTINSEEARSAMTGVLQSMIAGGATVIDTASSYKAAEAVIGDVVTSTSLRDKVFVATKMEATTPAEGEAELRRSLQRLRMARVDLVELHNVADPKQSLGMFRNYKAQGLCRYFGVTSTRQSDYQSMETVVRREKPDFMQVAFSIGDRLAEERLLPAAADAGAAVLAAQPVGGIHHPLFRFVQGKELPGIAKDIGAESWAQFFLKYVLSHPALTVAIPGTTKAAHMVDDIGAMRGRLPDGTERKRMAAYFDTLR